MAKRASRKSRKKAAGRKKKVARRKPRKTAARKRKTAKKSSRKKTARKKTAKKKATRKKTIRKKSPARKKKRIRAAKPKRAARKPARRTGAAASRRSRKPEIIVPPPRPGSFPVPGANEQKIGRVIHYYSHLGVAVVRMERGILGVGDTIHIQGHTSNFRQRVESMEVEHEKIPRAAAGQEFGLKVIEHAREHDVVFKVG